MITTGLCSPCRGITILGIGSVQEDSAHQRPRLEESQVVALIFVLNNMY